MLNRIIPFFIVLIPLIKSLGHLTLIDSPEINIPFSIANFGQVPYGKNIIGELQFAEPKNACNFQPQMTSNFQASKESFVLVALRGNCSFVQKAYVAEKIGASMLIVVDNVLEMTEIIIPMSLNDSDDTHNLTIPTLFIAKNDGDAIFFKAQNSSLVINASFAFKKSDKVNCTFWLTTSNPQSMKFMASIKEFYKLYAKAGEESLNFEVHYTGLFHCKFSNITNYNYYPDNCISGGRFCSAYPEGSNSSIAPFFILEDLRQLCLYKINVEAWWKYVSKFNKQCQENPIFYENCSLNLLEKIEKKLKIQNLKQKTQKCFNDSFLIPENENTINIMSHDNILLQQERRVSIENALEFWPSVTINNEIYRGSLFGDFIISALCQSFESTPNFCRFSEEKTLINRNVIIIVLMMMVFIALIGVIIYCVKYKKNNETKIRTFEISEIVGKYYVLNENKINKA